MDDKVWKADPKAVAGCLVNELGIGEPTINNDRTSKFIILFKAPSQTMPGCERTVSVKLTENKNGLPEDKWSYEIEVSDLLLNGGNYIAVLDGLEIEELVDYLTDLQNEIEMDYNRSVETNGDVFNDLYYPVYRVDRRNIIQNIKAGFSYGLTDGENRITPKIPIVIWPYNNGQLPISTLQVMELMDSNQYKIIGFDPSGPDDGNDTESEPEFVEIGNDQLLYDTITVVQDKSMIKALEIAEELDC